MKSRLIAAAVAVALGVVGTVVLVSYVRGIDARPAAVTTKTALVLVATAPIPLGTAGTALSGLVTTKSLPTEAVLADRVTNIEQLADEVALVALVAGEQLLASKFGPASDVTADTVEVLPTLQQVTVLLQPKRALGGRVAVGDRVGVFISLASQTTHLSVQKVLVTAVAQASPPAISAAGSAEVANADAAGGDATSSPSSDLEVDPTIDVLVTLAVTAAEAEKIVFAAEFGSIWLSNEPATADEAGTQILDASKVYQ